MRRLSRTQLNFVWTLCLLGMVPILFHIARINLFRDRRSPTNGVTRPEALSLGKKVSAGIPEVTSRNRTYSTKDSLKRKSENHIKKTVGVLKPKQTLKQGQAVNRPTKLKEIPDSSFPVKLVLFSTWITKRGKENVQKSVLENWRLWYPDITPVLLTGDKAALNNASHVGWKVKVVGETACGKSKMPTMRGLFKDAMEQFKGKSHMYGFANGDLVFDADLINTLTAFIEKKGEVIKTKPVMILSKRINTRVKENYAVTDVSEIRGLAKRGTYPAEGSSDIFITNHLFPWERVPEIVIGRLGFGMWIVAFARANNVTLFDITKTTTAVHMTTKEGIFESSKSNDAWCNHKFVNEHKLRPKAYTCGWIDCADWRSEYTSEGEVIFKEVNKTSLWKGCNACQ